ncbi:hypothetical protein BsWGS_14633 [Bradybaena similaris]
MKWLTVNRQSCNNIIVTVTLALMLVVANPPGEWLYLEDCDETCPGRDDAKCEVRCREIRNNLGEDCLNMFFDANNNRLDCHF